MKRIRSFLCSLILATQLDAQFIGADGAPQDMRTRGAPKPWVTCGDAYRKQFDTYPLQEGISNVKGKKDLEKRVIPYAISGSRDIAFLNLDNAGKDDYVSVRSSSRVGGCALSREWLLKENDIYVETELYGGRTFKWQGDLITGIERVGQSHILRVYSRDVDGKETVKNLNYEISSPPDESQKGF